MLEFILQAIKLLVDKPDEVNIEIIEKAQMNDNTKYVSLGVVSKILGAKF